MAKLTPEQQTILDHEHFIQEVLKSRIQTPPASPVANATSSVFNFWSFLQSSAGTTLITVVLGTIGGTIVTQLVQMHSATREAKRLSIAEYSKAQETSANEAFTLIADGNAAAEDIAELTEKGFRTDINSFPKEQADRMQKQIETTLQKFNEADDAVRHGADSLGFRIRLYYHSDQAVNLAWDHTLDSLTNLMDCQRSYYEANQHLVPAPSEQIVKAACNSQRKQLKTAEVDLTQAMAAIQVKEYEP